MTPEGDPAHDIPSPDEIRATVDRMIVSDAFSRSPQLGAFLRFVVESVLHGKGDRIKGYTIGVEVLRRDASFDPQSDPIVRVEATRLRRTIERYYAGPGADDPVIVDLPRGSYVPTFRRRQVDESAFRWLQRLRARVERMPRRGLVLAALAAILLGAIGAALLQSARVPSVAEAPSPLPPGNGMPTLSVERLDLTGTPEPNALSPSLLSEQIRDAFSRFDTINITLDPKDGPGHRIDYRLLGSIDYHGDQTASIRFRLLDNADGNIVWSQGFDRVLITSEQVAESEIVLRLTTALMQNYGFIRSRDRAKHLASDQGDPRYRCILEASDALRSQEPAQHDSARACLERLTSIDPSFSVGFSLLSIIYYREFLYGYGARVGDAPPLDRAIRMARRAIELNPASSRGYQMLFVILFARGETAAAFAAGDKAIALNPYEMLTVGEYGGRLIMIGEIERGMAMLRRSAEYSAVRPSWHHFYLFLGNYLNGDIKEATYQVGQITSENYSFGYVAKALVAAATGDAERARQAIDRLVALQPGWREDPRRELGKIIPKPDIVDRLMRDLAAAGLVDRP